MAKAGSAGAKEKLMCSASELIRRNGYVATSVDDVCVAAGVTKGAFFHYFPSKEALAQACLEQWDAQTMEMLQSAPFQAASDPMQKLAGCMDFFISAFSNPRTLKSCLAG